MEKPAGPALSKGRVRRGSLAGVTPKANCASVSGVRPFMGMLSTMFELITWPTDAVAVEQTGVGGDRHAFGLRADFQLDVLRQALVSADLNAFLAVFEAGGFGAEVIGSWRKEGEARPRLRRRWWPPNERPSVFRLRQP